MSWPQAIIKPDGIILSEPVIMPASGSGGSGRSLSDLEEQALLSLVQDAQQAQAQGGKAWTANLRGWEANSDIPICEWEGVTCRDASHVVDGGASSAVITGINVTQQGLSGTIPTELGLLTDLEHLSLNNNILRGSIPQEIANLAKLKTLDLTNCYLTGTLPQHFESSQLTQLLLANNAISGKFFEDEASTHLHSLREIRMENNLLTGTINGPSISKMSHLKVLSLSDNDLSGLIPGGELGSLPYLHYLYLDANHLVGPLPSQLAQTGRSQILELWVQDNALSGTVPATYSRFYQLHDLYIDNNKLTGALPPDLCSPQINEDFYAGSNDNSADSNRNHCDSIACPAGTTSPEGMYPCEQCPGGEGARIKNRYLGHNGKCTDYTQREILEMFHEATTKGGPWNGEDDWGDKTKSVCSMTGITCDAQDHVIKIVLKNRRLQGHIPDEIGLLSFLEVLDVSDNALMGYVPGDLQWTSMKRLDLSGNKHRGMIPPLLCKMGEVNGNGDGNIFHCDRIACPAGTYNEVGYHRGGDGGEECRPCYDDSPYIGQKTCAMPQPPRSDWKETVQTIAKESREKVTLVARGGQGSMGVAAVAALVTGAVVSTIAITLCCYFRRRSVRSASRWKAKNSNVGSNFTGEGRDDNDGEEEQSLFQDDGHEHFRYRDDVRILAGGNMVRNDSQEEYDDEMDDYSYDPYPYGEGAPEREFPAGSGHHQFEEATSVDSDNDDDGTVTSWSRRSATDFIREHQGIALNKRERLRRAVSGRLSSGDLNRKARETASSINIGARRRWHAHIVTK